MADAPFASAAPNEADHNIEIVQLAPSPGHIVLHADAKTTSSPGAQTCHLSIESFPEAVTTSGSASVARPRARPSAPVLDR
jgi:hypothetical protein